MMTVEDIAGQVRDRTGLLASVAAPSFGEQDRARLVESWWRGDGLDPVRIDEVGNVLAPVRSNSGPVILVCAHLDTVFGTDVPHVVQRDGGRLRGPSVGDDSVGVASLSALHYLLPRDLEASVWIVATVGEEGAGNLHGIRFALDGLSRVDALVAVEGNYLGRVANTGVGSYRVRVTFSGPGGHAWEASQNPSAIHACARFVSSIDAFPTDQTSTLNVGRISGGEAINARALRCWAEVELRSVNEQTLLRLEERIRACAEEIEPHLAVQFEVIGRRPAGHLDHNHPLVRAAIRALEHAWGTHELVAASTDANEGHARGVPAIAIGITTGGGEHTLNEWIELQHIQVGLLAMADTLVRFVETDR